MERDPVDNQGDLAERALLARARACEPEAVSVLYRRHADAIYRFILHRVGEAAIAEDLLGDVFVSALERLPAYRDEGRPFEAWLFRIAHNKVVDFYRRQRVRNTVTLHEELASGAETDPHDLVPQRDEASRAWSAVRQLTDEQQQVLELRFLAGYSIGEIAAQLSKTEGAIKQLQHRALAALRRLMGETHGR